MQLTIDIFVGVVTLLMVGAIIWLGIKQIGQLREQLVSQARTSQEQMTTVIRASRAALLPQIDARYCEPIMSQAQQLLKELYSEVRTRCKEKDRSSAAYKAQFQGAATEILDDWRENRSTEYLQLMALCDFYELVGLLCHRQYLNLEDILDLYSLAIINPGTILETHIKHRQSQEQRDVYEWFLYLLDESRKSTPDYHPETQLG